MVSGMWNHLERSRIGVLGSDAGAVAPDKFQRGIGWTLVATILVNLGYAFLLLWV